MSVFFCRYNIELEVHPQKICEKIKPVWFRGEPYGLFIYALYGTLKVFVIRFLNESKRKKGVTAAE